MSEAHQYHRPNAPDSPLDESDSDIDLDLQELDPATTQGRLSDYENKYSGYGRGRRSTQPRKLWGERRGLHSQDSLHVSGGVEDGDIELDTLGSGQVDTNARDFAGYAEDNAPLLGHNSASTAIILDDQNQRGVLSRRFGLSKYVPGCYGQNKAKSGSKSQSQTSSRNFTIGQYPPPRFPPNAVSNAKYTPWSFLPRTLYNEFSFFFNMYFLLVALSQIIPPLRIGYLSTYVAPLAFVLTITLGKEALDDIARRRRDNEANNEGYTVLRLRDTSQAQSRKKGKTHTQLKRFSSGRTPQRFNRLDAIVEEEDNLGETDYDRNIEVDEIIIRSKDLKVGDVLRLGKDQRVPADVVILKSFGAETVVAPKVPFSPSSQNDGSEPLLSRQSNVSDEKAVETVALGSPENKDAADVGEAFIKTDQLDGETDWKLRLASPLSQSLDARSYARLRIVAGKPDQKVNDFVGTIEYMPRSAISSNVRNEDRAGSQPTDSLKSAPLNIDNTAWANTVLASNATVLAVIVYTGAQTRQAMSTLQSRSKTGLLEREINDLTKILCALTLTLSIVLVALEGLENRKGQKWYVAILRFLILFSTIIPISLRVNLDMGKTVYAWFIERDQDVPDTVVRTSTIPEDLGRIEYLLSDKTGTLTQNGKKMMDVLNNVC